MEGHYRYMVQKYGQTRFLDRGDTFLSDQQVQKVQTKFLAHKSFFRAETKGENCKANCN